MLRIALLIFCLALLAAPVAAQQTYEPPLTNASIVKLVRAGFKEKLLIALIRSRPNRFDLSPDRLIELKRNGVPEKIIMAMLELEAWSSVSDEDWSEDSFFKKNKPSRGNGSSDPNSEETDIFSSNGGSNSQTESRGMRGSNSGETVTTGSATVRIIRPPAEASGASLKLERTPTLNNESIIQLVEAGFSEGTIIKRIEDSPADFDLSPEKLTELRKRRVTEAIITAMTQAMEGSVPKTNTSGRNGES